MNGSTGRWIALLAASLVAGGALAQTEIRLASPYPEDSFHVQNLQRFAQDVQNSTGGKLKVKVHSNASLLKSAEIFAGVRDGKAEAGEVIMSSASKEIPLFALDTLPFIVSGYDDARALWEASRVPAAEQMAAKGLQLLYTVPWQPQNLYSTRKIETARDFAGLRLRHYAPTTERIAEMLGAKPVAVPVQMDEIAKAMNNDVYDLSVTSSWTGVQIKSWNKMKYYYKVNAWIPKNMVFMNKARFDALDAPARKAVLDAARAAETRGWTMSQALDQSLEAELAANKTTIGRLDPVTLRFFDRVGEQMAKEWLKQAPMNDVKVLNGYMIRRSTR